MDNVIIGAVVLLLAIGSYWLFKEEADEYAEQEEQFREYMNSRWHNKR